MTGLHEALDDIATEITPLDPPVELAMRLGRRKRHGRRIAAVAGTAGVIAVSAVGLANIPATNGPASAPGAASDAAIPLARPVLLESPQGSAKEYGDADRANAGTLRLFHQLACTPGVSAPGKAVTNDSWKATAGYTAAAQWNAPGSEVVSCDAFGNKYVLGKAVILGSQVTSATTEQLPHNGQWIVDVTLNGAATAAFKQLTTSQAKLYPAASTSENAVVLASTAIVINGDVQSAPVTEAPITNGQLAISGPQPAGFTQAEAKTFAAQLP